jgi:large subunit ribosomal protein L1
MAKKAELLEQAKKLGLELTEKSTIAQIEAAINDSPEAAVIPTEAERSSPEKEILKQVQDDNADVQDDKVSVAKAGKRSAKGVKEAEEKTEKIEHQVTGEHEESEATEVKKGPAPKIRTKLERRSKAYRKSAELIDSSKIYSVKGASEVLPQTSTVKFDASVEVHVKLGVDPRQADQNIRAMVELPNGTGKTLRVAVFAPEDQHEAAKKAGADIVGADDFLQLLDKNQLDFDVLIATPLLMAKLGKYARVLGPKGLMPNPKSGTVTTKVADAVKSAKAGKVEFRVDKQGIIHQAVGKVSFTPAQIAENAEAVLTAIKDAKPSSIKGTYIEKIVMTTTMGPSVVVASS